MYAVPDNKEKEYLASLKHQSSRLAQRLMPGRVPVPIQVQALEPALAVSPLQHLLALASEFSMECGLVSV